MRHLLIVVLLGGLAGGLLAGPAAARDVRVFTVSPRFDLRWVDTPEHFAEKLDAMVDAGRRGGDGLVQDGVGDVRSRLLGPTDASRPAATARDLVTLPEDLGLMAAFSGSRAATARQAGGLVEAIAALIGSYAPVNAYYAAKFPSLATRPAPPTRLLAVALTDTFVRVGVESFARTADRLDAYVVAGVTLAQDWQVVCASKATYVAPPGAGPCVVEDAARVAALRDPDEPTRTYAYEATTAKPSTMALVFDPDGRLVAKTVKAYLTPVELPGGLDLVPGEVDGVQTIATPVGRLGIVTSKDAWMPDITRKLDQERTEILVQPEFFVGSTVATTGPWNPDTLMGSGASDVLRHPQLQAMAQPQLVGNVFDFSADAQGHIVTRDGGRGALVGQPPAPGFAAVAPWAVADPGGSFAARRAELGRSGEAQLPSGPPCSDPRRAGPCAGGQAESVLAADVTVGETPRYRRTAIRKVTPGTVVSAARPLRPGRAPQRNVALTSRGRTVWAAWEERRGGSEVVYVARSRDGGRRFARPVRLGPGWWPSISAGTGGRLWVAYEREGGVRVARSRDGGRRFATTALPGPAPQHKPAVAAVGTGAYVAWIDHRGRSADDGLPQAGLYGASISAAGRAADARRLDPTGPAAPFAEQLDHAWAPTLAVRGRRLTLGWIDFRGYDWSVFARESADGGRRFGPTRRLNDQPDGVEALDDAPAAVITTDGRGRVAFTDWVNPADSAQQPSGLYDTRLARADGAGASTQVDGDGRAFRSTFSPALVAAGRDVVVAWQDARRSAGRIRLARVSGGRPGPIRRVGFGSAGQYRPALIAAGPTVVAAWEDHRDGPSRIYVSRVSARRLR